MGAEPLGSANPSTLGSIDLLAILELTFLAIGIVVGWHRVFPFSQGFLEIRVSTGKIIII